MRAVVGKKFKFRMADEPHFESGDVLFPFLDRFIAADFFN